MNRSDFIRLLISVLVMLSLHAASPVSVTLTTSPTGYSLSIS